MDAQSDDTRVLLFATTPATRRLGDALEERPGVAVVVAESADAPAETIADAPDVDCVLCDHDPPEVDATVVGSAADADGLPCLLGSDVHYADLTGDPLAGTVDGFHRVLADDPQSTLAIRRIERTLTERERERTLASERAHREALFEDPDVAVAILDTDGQLTDINGRALAFAGMFGQDDEVVGKPFWETPWVTRAGVTKGEIQDALEQVLSGHVVTSTTAARDANHNLIEVEITFRPVELDGEIVGIVVTGEDITKRRSQERRRRVLSRVLRHNVRNDLSAITGRAEHIETQASGEVLEDATTIQQVADELNDKCELVRRVEQSLSIDRDEIPTVDVARILDHELDRLEGDNPGIDIERSIPGSQLARAEAGIDIAFRALLENTVEHVDDPTIAVELELTPTPADDSGPLQSDEAVEIRITDDGPGIPDHEIEVLDEGVETALEHSSGLGLWAANWFVQGSGGTLRLTESDAGGTVAVITLSPADDEAESHR